MRMMSLISSAAVASITALASISSAQAGAGWIASGPVYSAGLPSYHACTVANISAKPVTVRVQMISNAGAILTDTNNYSLAAGKVDEYTDNYVSFSYCKVWAQNTASVRARMVVIRYLADQDYNETLDSSDLR